MVEVASAVVGGTFFFGSSHIDTAGYHLGQSPCGLLTLNPEYKQKHKCVCVCLCETYILHGEIVMNVLSSCKCFCEGKGEKADDINS